MFFQLMKLIVFHTSIKKAFGRGIRIFFFELLFLSNYYFLLNPWNLYSPVWCNSTRPLFFKIRIYQQMYSEPFKHIRWTTCQVLATHKRMERVNSKICQINWRLSDTYYYDTYDTYYFRISIRIFFFGQV